MHLLVINPGSSSIKFSMFRAQDSGGLVPWYEGELSGVGGTAALKFRSADGEDLGTRLGAVQAATMQEAIDTVERAVALDGLPRPEAVGYRVVHPGAKLQGHQRLTPEVLQELKGAVAFAPLHDPSAIEIIEEMMRRLPEVPHFACFDTVFHETMPEEAKRFPLPNALWEEGVRRYGFHGLSCESVVVQMGKAAGVGVPQSMLIAHLGSGCSVTACVEGKSVDTTMGLTPTGGVVMGTRPGDLDPGLVLYLLRRPGAAVESVEAMLNHDAGLKGLGGNNDMRTLRKGAAAGDSRAAMALRLFARSLAKTVAGLAAVHRPDTVVFTGGIGEHDEETRAEVAAALWAFGAELDTAANAAGKELRQIDAPGSRVALFIVPAEEDLMIARHVAAMMRSM